MIIKMTLLEKYLELCNADGEKGFSDKAEQMYLFDFTKNFRNLHKFEDGYRTFKKICSMTDAEKQSYVEESPVQAKSFMGNMLRTRLFYAKGGKIVPTEMG